jgi:hypothetical protein
MRSPDVQVIHEVNHVVGQLRSVLRRIAGLGALSKATHVHGDDAMARRQYFGHRAPVGERSRPSVKHDDGIAGPDLTETNRHVVYGKELIGYGG